jgi:urease accessory protein
MLVVREGVLGNLAAFDAGGRRIERIAVRSDDCAKRVLRFETSAGDVGVRFAGDVRLADGDIVHVDAERVIAVAVTADDVLVFRPATIGAAIDLAHALGNRHLPILRDGETIVVRYDPLLEALGEAHGVPVMRQARVVPAPFLHAHAPHTHD